MDLGWQRPLMATEEPRVWEGTKWRECSHHTLLRGPSPGSGEGGHVCWVGAVTLACPGPCPNSLYCSETFRGFCFPQNRGHDITQRPLFITDWILTRSYQRKNQRRKNGLHRSTHLCCSYTLDMSACVKGDTGEARLVGCQ